MKTTLSQLVLRQGDVALIAIAAIPKDATPQPTKGGKVILALGEATGHHHRFERRDTSDGVKLYHCGNGARYLEVTALAELLHEEHSTVRVPPGKYLLPTQVEYTPKELVRVAD